MGQARDNLDVRCIRRPTDLVFSAARAMSGNSSRSAAVTPLYNPWHSTVRPTSILRVMQGHYGSLQLTPQVTRWTCNTGMIVSLFKSPTPPTIRNSDILDQDFSWNQIAAALLQMSPRKAPGRCNNPRAWLCASIVSIDKKDGDPLNPGDKRSITLINVDLKLVCKVLQMRIERFVETNNLLSTNRLGSVSAKSVLDK
ncbi:hypothetical protein BASA81_017757 [Batrachochytrium salamandrivorans]|nr:hypothetical protein BASA81_017757 [Batrachochytrium salamandrivorans]